MSSNEYILDKGEADKLRLETLDLTYGESSREFIKRSGLKKGMVAADFSCGHGVMSAFMSEIVGPEGKVVGLDNSDEQLDVSRGIYGDFKNLSFYNVDIYNTEKYKESFDFVYCRYLLVNLKNPEIALDSLLSTLKPGGIVAIEDSWGIESCSCYPELKSFYDLIECLKTIYLREKFDIYIGRKLRQLFFERGVKDISTTCYFPVLDTPEKRLFPYLDLLMPIVENELSPEDFVRMKEELLVLEKDESRFISLIPIVQNSGIK